MYAVTRTHTHTHPHIYTYGTDTTDNMANIPSGTPREGSWEQGWLTKLGGKGASMGQAWRKSWHHVNASVTMMADERPSPPLHNQHIIREPISAWAQKTRPGNLMFHHILLLPSSSARVLSVVLPGWDGFRGCLPTQGWSHSEIWPSDLGSACRKATVANGTWGNKNPIEMRLIWQGGLCYLPIVYISILEGGLGNDVSIWLGLSFHQLRILPRECMKSVWKWERERQL